MKATVSALTISSLREGSGFDADEKQTTSPNAGGDGAVDYRRNAAPVRRLGLPSGGTWTIPSPRLFQIGAGCRNASRTQIGRFSAVSLLIIGEAAPGAGKAYCRRTLISLNQTVAAPPWCWMAM